jgi:hypothetical protein
MLTWLKQWWSAQGEPSEEMTFAVLRIVKREMGLDASPGESEQSLLAKMEKATQALKRAKAMPRGHERALYIKWIEYCRGQMARYLREEVMWRRVEALQKQLPRI